MGTSPPQSGQASREYWRALSSWLRRAGDESPEPGDARVERRELLKLLGASLGLAGVTSCERERTDKILPYTVPPREVTPGIAQTYATSMELDGFATGLLVRSHEGRPTKIEGNPEHPASLGAAGPFEQASVLSLYDPHRARAIRHVDRPSTFDELTSRFGAERRDGGGRLRFLLPPTGSPLVGELVARVKARHPEARFTFYSALRTTNAREGGRAAFGAPVQPQYDFGAASVVLSIDADFLSGMPFSLRYARQFAERRRTSTPSDAMNRLYAVETMMTPTGSIADHRVRTKPSEIGSVLAAIAAELGAILGGRLPPVVARALQGLRSDRDPALMRAIAKDLADQAPASVVVVGETQPASVHALGCLVNALLLRSDAFRAIAPTTIDASLENEPLPELLRDISGHGVDTLVMLEGNPVYTIPPDFEFARHLPLVDETLYLGAYENETAELASWFVPAAHFLESWGDARAYDGTASIAQPLIDPLIGGRTAPELLALFAGDRTPRAHELLKASWTKSHGAKGFDSFWQETLVRGIVAGSASAPFELKAHVPGLLAAIEEIGRAPAAPGSLELAFAADAGVYDGRFANNGWLQEFPRPITKLTWDNAAMMSPKTAARLDVHNDDVVELRRAGRSVRLPVLLVPGHADDAITAHLGFGRRGAEELAQGVGSNVYVLRTTDALAFAGGIEAEKVPGARHPLALTQVEFSTDGRPVAMSATLAEWLAHPDFTSEERGPLPSFFEPKHTAGEQWAMTIDTSICTGCGACVLGCQSENNIFVVGKTNVAKGRAMHWLRIDTYFSGPPEEPEVVQEPMLCQHCERAPCEYVCPVNATVHSPDGLNEMVYNRCVGTRFCSNNCPYKVRRFNWFDWVEREPANQGLVRLQRNPNVTVRERGVMEKCTYCVQRIRGAEIVARNERRAIRPGEVVTACQQACPTQAIQFGSLGHAGTKMVEWRAESRAFAVLHELGTVPRTQYLARIKNPNPAVGS